MADPNTSSRWAWAYEGTNGTSSIDDATDTTYQFGEYGDNIQQWEAAAVENSILAYHVYNSRTPTLADGRRNFPPFKHMYNPTTAQFLCDILGSVADASPDTIAALDTGYQYSKTIRYEEGTEGTNDRHFQTVGNYCISAFMTHTIGEPLIVEQEFAFQSIQDAGDEPVLTTAPTQAGGEKLEIYDGLTVTYDHGGGGETILDLINKVDYKITQKYNPVRNTAGTTQTIYKGKYSPIDIVLYGIFPTNLSWNQYIDRTVKDYEIKHLKPNTTDYIACQMNNCRIGKPRITASKFKGWSNIVFALQAEDVDVTFNFEGSNFSTHFKGVVV